MSDRDGLIVGSIINDMLGVDEWFVEWMVEGWLEEEEEE